MYWVFPCLWDILFVVLCFTVLKDITWYYQVVVTWWKVKIKVRVNERAIYTYMYRIFLSVTPFIPPYSFPHDLSPLPPPPPAFNKFFYHLHAPFHQLYPLPLPFIFSYIPCLFLPYLSPVPPSLLLPLLSHPFSSSSLLQFTSSFLQYSITFVQARLLLRHCHLL